MIKINEFEKGTYILFGGKIVTEREKVKSLSDRILENSAIADSDEFYEKYGSNYDLDNDEVYKDFYDQFNDQISEKIRRYLTLNLESTDLSRSSVTLNDEIEPIEFKNWDIETTRIVFNRMNVDFGYGTAEIFYFDDDYDVDGIKSDYLSYIDNNKLVFRTDLDKELHSLPELVDLYYKKCYREVSKKQIHKQMDLVSKLSNAQRLHLDIDVINIDESTDTYSMFDMKYGDAHKLMNEKTFYVYEDLVYDVDFNLVKDDELVIGDISFTDYVLEQHANGSIQKYNQIIPLQDVLVCELNEEHRSYEILKMHNNKDNRTLSEQVETLSNNTLRLGDCDYEEGYLVNHQNMIAFVIPEKNLAQKALFEDAQSKFNFSSDKITFQFKDSEGEIDYLVRENHQKGFVELKGQYYQVFEKKPDAHGDATTAVFLKVDEDFALKKICEIEEEKLESVYGVKLDDMKFESGKVVADFKVPKFDYMFVITHNKKKDEMLFDDISVFEDAVDSANPDSKPSDQDLYSSLTNLVEAKSKLNHKSLSNDEMDRKIKSQELTIDAPQKKKSRSLRM
ncbi:hypothetical protein [Vibrio bivalvicida]|uniref:DUF4868 domain-containing protein n=1 Tax=Vibrio bivalvicida TaxID=1276888 RepID=A0ABV4MMS6_9VIBR